MKKIIKIVINLLLSIPIWTLLIPLLAFAGKAAGDYYELNGLDPGWATIKPKLIIETKIVDASLAGTNVTLNLMVEGASGKYSNTGLLIQCDSRLKLVQKNNGYAEKGDAGKKLSYTEEKNGENSIFLTTSGDQNNGNDGVLWQLNFEIPVEVKDGDFYPVEIAYKDAENIKCHFINCEGNQEGQLMQAWVFTNGIVQGGFRIKGTHTTTIRTTTTTMTTKTSITTTQNIKYNIGDVNNNSIIDAVDAALVLKNYALISTGNVSYLTEAQKLAANVNGDSMIDAVDAAKILSFYAYVSTDGTLGFVDYLRQPIVTTTKKTTQYNTTTTTNKTTSKTTSKTTTSTTRTTTIYTTMIFKNPTIYMQKLPSVDSSNPNADKIMDLTDKIVKITSQTEGYISSANRNLDGYNDILKSLNQLDGDLQKAKVNLENAQNNKIRVYDAARGWRYAADSEKIAEAKNEITSCEDRIVFYNGLATSYIERINWYIEIIDSNNEKLRDYYSQIESLL